MNIQSRRHYQGKRMCANMTFANRDYTGVHWCTILECVGALYWNALVHCIGVCWCTILECVGALYWSALVRCIGVRWCTVLAVLHVVVLEHYCDCFCSLQARVSPVHTGKVNDTTYYKSTPTHLGLRQVASTPFKSW